MKKPTAYLNSNDGSGILAFGSTAEFILTEGDEISKLQQFLDTNSDHYIFGYLSYETKDCLFGLNSGNQNTLGIPLAYFWVPQYVVRQKNEHLEFLQGRKTFEILDFVNTFLEEETDQNFHPHDFQFTSNVTKEEYLRQVRKLQDHIQNGDIYEINYCQEFTAENADIPYTLDTYFKLNLITKAPFSVYLETDEHLICCGSPERYLKKSGSSLISQPIKGTAPRSSDPAEDQDIRDSLMNDQKERSENVMIVDLVRNDLSQIAEPNSVRVDELCEVYSYETVHHMISTIACEVSPSVTFTDIIRATFPMGSMTGAPKLKAMELIEECEGFRRGLYSGTIGYICPNGDFDFNVVIRTLIYNKTNKLLSCAVGSAITSKSIPEREYEECEVKIRRILEGMNA